MKYKEWLDVWFANYIEPSSKTKTCERYSEIIEKHLKVKLGEYELEELSPIVIQKYITELMQSGNLTTGKGLAANSVNGIITVIQNSLKLAYTLGELKEYTTDKIRRPKTKEKEVSCFSLAEQKKIEQAALSNKKRKFIGIVICLYSGLRIGELLALTWADIDFTKGTLAVNKTCHDGRDENGNLCRITDLPKTTSSKRKIPLPKQLLPVLKEYKRKSVSEYVVESEKGEPPSVIYTAVEKAGEKISCDPTVLTVDETCTYKRTQEIMRYSNEIARLTASPSPSFKAGKKLILECASLKFQACRENKGASYTNRILQLTKNKKYDIDYISDVVSKIIVEKDGTVTVAMINGAKISNREVNDAGTSEKSCNEDRCQSDSCQAE